MPQKIIATDKEHLKQLIKNETDINGHECSLNHIDVSKLTDMSFLFYNSLFNGNISEWNTSCVTDMKYMFHNSDFCGNLSKWDVSNVTDMSCMFYGKCFYGDISDWKPYSLEKNDNLFNRPNVIKPYWSKIRDSEERRTTINHYHLSIILSDSKDDKDKTSKNRAKI